MIFGSTFPRLRNRIPFHFKPLNFRRHGAYLGIKSLLSLRKISKIIISKINFKISNSRKIAKIENFWIRNIFDPFARKIVIQNLRHDSALSLFPPKHMGVRLALRHCDCFWLQCPHFWVWSTRPRDSRGHSLCDLCFIQKLSFLRGQLPIRQTLWISRLFS